MVKTAARNLRAKPLRNKKIRSPSEQKGTDFLNVVKGLLVEPVDPLAVIALDELFGSGRAHGVWRVVREAWFL